jgi:hypothetical protein
VWKAHPVVLRSRVVAIERPHPFAIVADTRGLHADRAFTIRSTPDGTHTVVVSHETQVGPLAWLGRLYLAPRLRAANQVMFDDLARAAAPSVTTPIQRAGVASLIRTGSHLNSSANEPQQVSQQVASH